MFKRSDDLNRELRKNVYITKIKDAVAFIQLINNIYKSIIGKNNINHFYFKFDRILNITIEKIHEKTFQFIINLKNIKTNMQMYVEDLYYLLYLFFVDIEVICVDIQSKDFNHTITTKFRINAQQDQKLLIKDVLLRIKHIKKTRRSKKN